MQRKVAPTVPEKDRTRRLTVVMEGLGDGSSQSSMLSSLTTTWLEFFFSVNRSIFAMSNPTQLSECTADQVRTSYSISGDRYEAKMGNVTTEG